MVQQDHFVLTRQGYAALQRELRALEAEQREAFAEYTDANDKRDPSPEEAAYFEARTREEFVDQQVDYLRAVLERAQVLDEDPDPLRIDPGDRITVWDFQQQKEQQFDLVGDSPEVIFERDGISVESPVGKALFKHQIGDVVEVDTPDGKMRYCIRKVERIPNRD